MILYRMENNDIYIWLGGSFSPPTLAHMNIAKIGAEYIANKNPDKNIHLYFIPVNDHYNKASVKCVNFANRSQMLMIAADALNKETADTKIMFGVSDIEYVEGKSREKPVKTWKSLELFIKEYNANPENVYLMQGQDNIAGILKGSWENSYDLIFKSKLLCIPRKEAKSLSEVINLKDLKTKDSQFNDKTEKDIMGRVEIIDTIPNLISSSELRKQIRESESETNEKLLEIADPKILEYIFKNKLYRTMDCEEPPKGGRRKLRKTRRSSLRLGKKTRRH